MFGGREERVRVIVDAGTIQAVDASQPAASFMLSPSASPITGAYAGFEITVATNASASSPAQTAVVSSYGPARAVELAVPLATAPRAGSSYVVQSLPTTVLGSTGSWNMTSGSLTVPVQAGQALLANLSYCFSLVLTNGQTAQAGPAVSIAASGPQPVAAAAMSAVPGAIISVRITHHGEGYTRAPKLFSSQSCTCAGSPTMLGDMLDPVASNWRVVGSMDKCLLPTLPRGAVVNLTRASGAAVTAWRGSGASLSIRLADSMIPLAPAGAQPPELPQRPVLPVLATTLTLGRIGQSTPYPGALNTISLTLAWNVAMTPRASVTLSGLAGAAVAGSALGSVPIAGAHAGRFASTTGGELGTAAWDPRLSTLTLFVQANVSAFAVSRFSFLVLNPPRAQVPPFPTTATQPLPPLPCTPTPFSLEPPRLFCIPYLQPLMCSPTPHCFLAAPPCTFVEGF